MLRESTQIARENTSYAWIPEAVLQRDGQRMAIIIESSCLLLTSFTAAYPIFGLDAKHFLCGLFVDV